jgi:hypothetical protein
MAQVGKIIRLRWLVEECRQAEVKTSCLEVEQFNI